MFNFASAFTKALGPWLLYTWSGYLVSTDVNVAYAAQTDGTLNKLLMIYTIIPAVFVVLQAVPIFFYDMVGEKKDNIVKNKSTDFAVRIINLVKHLTKNMPYTEYAICTQLLKSGTSIGANIREAEHAESREDFIHKLKIALKEANETEYWLEIFYRAELLTLEQYESVNNDCKELNKLLISIIKNLKNN